MKTTLSWLKTHLETTASLDDIVKRLVMLGLEVESVADRSADLAPVLERYRDEITVTLPALA